MNTKKLVRGALVIALALALQSIRLIMPLPPMAGAFIIGTFVHTMLVVGQKACGFWAALIMSLLLPCTAYAQGQLVLPILVPVVMLGNLVFVVLLSRFTEGWQAHVVPPLGKAFFMSGGFGFMAMSLLHLDLPAVVLPVLFSMSVPQFVTGAIGISLARAILKHIRAN